MLDDNYLYQHDLKKQYEAIEKKNLDKLFKSLYSNARLSQVDTRQNAQELVARYEQLIVDLIKDNQELQHRVHELGVKNRVRKLLGRYKPLEIVRKYVSETQFEEISQGTFIKNHIAPLLAVGQEAFCAFEKASSPNFEESLEVIQKTIKSPAVSNPPLVSIIIPTRDGLHHLKRLFNNFKKQAGYSNFEVIVVDNASTDNTASFLEKLKKELNLRIIYNPENKSFSESNNIAAKEAKGEYLLFLNNDVQPTSGWLNHMVNTIIKDNIIGAVGAKLVYPYKKGFDNSYKIQHGGIGFKLENDFIRPINTANGEGFLSKNTQKEEEKAGVTAACLLIDKTKFDEIDGFDEAYWYGYEDVDLCLKLWDKGYKNVINNAAVLFHYEFGTQNKFDSKTISGYRRKNMEIFKNKWQRKLYPELWKSLIGEDKTFTDKQAHFGFIVTESNERTAAGDYFTAKELGNELQKRGYKVSYIGIADSPKPYDINPNIDVLISMLDGYDISQIKDSDRLVKIAWCRNWFERWLGHSYFRTFDIVLTNSERAQELFKIEHHINSYLFKIATNKERFTKIYNEADLADYKSDICFTGNYWHVPRDVSELFDVEKFKDRYSIKIFGKDWDHVKKLKPFWQGFIEYKDIPKVYAASKVLIDDATFVVNEWGSVNSRVFDGAASGVLVLTNGIEGSKKTFDGLVPTFNSRKELSELIEKYLGDDRLRLQKIKEIKEYALSHHTYEHRANELLAILHKELCATKINIKLPIPRWEEAQHWGDLHFAEGLKSALEDKEFNVKEQILPEWDQPNFAFANMVLRGLSQFTLPPGQLNIMWNISHPEKVSTNEYKGYDYVFVASGTQTTKLQNEGVENAHTLFQCYDDAVFNTEPSKTPKHYQTDILFVGNTRNHFRKIVRDVIKWKNIDKYTFKVYGKGWDKFIDSKYIGGEYINNNELKYYYQNTKVLLNDHWDDMNKHGFVSNRLFDASACKTFIISDTNSGINEVFGPDVIEEYNNAASLHKLLDKYLSDATARKERANKAQKIVSEKHSFHARVRQILATIKEF